MIDALVLLRFVPSEAWAPRLVVIGAARSYGSSLTQMFLKLSGSLLSP
jgi:hypothetical protein